MLNRTIDRITKKAWTDAELDAMVGPALGAYLTFATDESVRAQAASGGTTSALLIFALETGLIDGAIVCKTVIEDGKVRAHFALARTRDEILDARGSKYVATKFLKEVLPLLRDNDGRYAVCGLPCDISNLRRWEAREPELSAKVALRLAFLCGHNSREELVDGITRKLQKEAGAGCELVDYKFRTGHWRGELSATYSDGEVITKPFGYFSDYRNLYFFAERKCVACFDHFGYDADISLGDVWLYSLRDDPIKHTGILVRTPEGQSAFEALGESGFVNVAVVDRETILDGQARVAPTHYNVSARSKTGRLLGIKVPDTQQLRVGPIKWVSAFLGLLNMRLSEGRGAGVVLALPRPIVKAYLVFKKGLESLR